MSAVAGVLDCRPVSTVMDLERLGTLYPYPLSFMRCLVRRIMTEGWSITRTKFELDADGYGDAVYKIDTGNDTFNFVIFSHYLDSEDRSDRVIAEAWDMTATLCAGDLTDDRLARLKANVPLQEAGRVDCECFVLTRANKSSRNFNYVVDCLVQGKQPDVNLIAKVGYLFRTTAVYGSGKFGMADWEKVCHRYPDFSRPFMGEMLACFLIRQFSLELADWVAVNRAPETAATLSNDIKRYFGIGNATGLGMAPYLINHPSLISNWIHVKEAALSEVIQKGKPDASALDRFHAIGKKAIQHLLEISTDNIDQNQLNKSARTEAKTVLDWVQSTKLSSWHNLIEYCSQNMGVETQELINSILLEVHKDLIIGLEEKLSVNEVYQLKPEMSLSKAKNIIETAYDWALSTDYSDASAFETFWYRSEEKMEPRLGQRSKDIGAEKEMLLGIAWAVQCCYDDLQDYCAKEGNKSVGEFVFHYPKHRYILRRVQTMADTAFGEIRANVLDEGVLPIQLLRCKLSFFGVGKFDPKSKLWVRNTMFQGAPLTSDMGKPFKDDWFFPVMQSNG
ncbi:MAG: hypothetical protein HKN36_07770 [Hellea sp.]|nr:hypothetical protein [Hellea sp.]